MSIIDSESVQCLQAVTDATEGAYVICPIDNTRISVDVVSNQGSRSFWYSEDTIIMGRVGISTRAFCSWKCAAKSARLRSK